MKVNTKLLVAFVLGFLIIPCFIAAQENQDVLTLERIFKENKFKLNQFGPAVWLEYSSGYTTLEESGYFHTSVQQNDEPGSLHSQVIARGWQ